MREIKPSIINLENYNTNNLPLNEISFYCFGCKTYNTLKINNNYHSHYNCINCGRDFNVMAQSNSIHIY